MAWNRTLPGTDAVRPACCPACATASRPLGRALNLVGHGVRARVIFGLIELTDTSGFVEVIVRRFRCLRCGAICTVVPAGVSSHRYSDSTIQLALALWAINGLSAAQVRRLLSPFQIVGASVTGWASLRRWARTYGIGAGSLRQRAARFVQHLLAMSPLSAQKHALEPRVFAASLSAARCPSC